MGTLGGGAGEGNQLLMINAHSINISIFFSPVERKYFIGVLIFAFVTESFSCITGFFSNT